MWAKVESGNLVEIIPTPKSVTVGEVLYSSQIFTAWTDTERKEVGVLPLRYTGTYGDDTFYTNADSAPAVGTDEVVITQEKTERSVSDVKATLKQQINKILKTYLDETDWVVVRKAETGKDAPTDIAKWRSDLRIKAAALESSIDGKSSVSDLEGLMASDFHDWPKLGA